MKKKIYIFNEITRASAYGIGTYLDQLISCLKGVDIDFGVIHLFTEDKEILNLKKDEYNQISIPIADFSDPEKKKYYSRNIVYLLKELLLEEEYTQYIFHLNFMSNPILADNLKKMFNCKIILTAHYTEWSFSLLGNYKKLSDILKKVESEQSFYEKQIFKSVNDDIQMIRNSDRLICVAKHTIDYFVDMCGINVSKCMLVNNALKDEYKEISSTKKNRIKEKYFIPPNSQIIIFAGRLDEVKGVSFLIKAFKRTLKRNPNTILLIAGDGDFNKYHMDSENYWSKILFTGRLNKKKLYELYHIADIGVVCSLHEEFGFVAIEMMMHKLPIIVTDTGGLSEIVEDNISGLKIPVITRRGEHSINTVNMAEKINLLLEEQDLASTIAEKGRVRFLEKYELSLFKEKMVKQYLNI